MKNNFMISIDLDLICSSKVHNKSRCDNLNLKFILFYFTLFYFIISSPGIIWICVVEDPLLVRYPWI